MTAFPVLPAFLTISSGSSELRGNFLREALNFVGKVSRKERRLVPLNWRVRPLGRSTAS
jgi:hypothetical protein